MKFIEGVNHVLAVDFGGSKVHAAVVNRSGGIMRCKEKRLEAKQSLTGVNVHHIPGIIMATIGEVFHRCRQERLMIDRIIIGTPGIVDEKGAYSWPPVNCKGIPNFNLKKLCEQRYNVITGVDNDAHVFSMGEAVMGAGKNSNIMVYFTLGTGLGGALVVEGKIFRGTSGTMEIGHMIVSMDPHAPVCGCGRQGCVEAYISDTALEKRIRASGIPIPKGMKIKAKEVYHMARKEKLHQAKWIVDEGHHALAVLISNFAHISVDTCVLAGGILKEPGNYVIREVRKWVKLLKPIPTAEIEVVPAALGEDYALIGGGCYGFTQEIVPMYM